MNHFRTKWTLDAEKFMSASEVKKLKRVIEDKAIADLAKGRTTWPRYWMVIDLALNTGMRVSELAGVRIGNIHLNTRQPRIRVTGKGNKTRDIYIPRALRDHLSEFLLWKGALGEGTDVNDFLLVSSHRRGFSSQTLQYAFKKSAREAGLPSYLSIHSTRHTFASFLFQKSKDLVLVQTLLGHASVSTTAVYTHTTAAAMTTAVNGLFEEGGDDNEDE